MCISINLGYSFSSSTWLHSLATVSEMVLARDIISQMLQFEASERPSAQYLLKHPFFWNKEKQLMFFQVTFFSLFIFVT